MEYEELVDRGLEGGGDAQREEERGVVIALLEGDDGLAGDADGVGKLLLGQAPIRSPYLNGEMDFRTRPMT